MMSYWPRSMPKEPLVQVSFLFLLLSPSNIFAEQYPGQIDKQTTVGALVYADSILAAASGGVAAPLWFAQAMRLALQPTNTRLDGIDRRLDGIDGRLDGIDARIDGIFAKIDQLITSTAKGMAGLWPLCPSLSQTVHCPQAKIIPLRLSPM
ncbi:hypothetical protein B0H10DRAFT_401643 [Mycena sp. CBHHK59/15]|nr:hypothetical protein B0H10DRAFT_401643 [Mycena sp. CBHHK59/15]